MNPNLQLVDQGPSIATKNMEKCFCHRMMETLVQILAELMSPPTIATVSSFVSFFSFKFVHLSLVLSLLLFDLCHCNFNDPEKFYLLP